MIVTISLIVGGILAILGYFAKKYGKCQWLGKCLSAQKPMDLEKQAKTKKSKRQTDSVFS